MDQLAARLGKGAQMMRLLELKARKDPKRIVFGEGEDPRVIRAAYEVSHTGIATPDSAWATKQDIRDQDQDAGPGFRAGDHRPIALAEASRAMPRRLLQAAPAQGRHLGPRQRPHAPEHLLRPDDGRAGDADAFIAGLTYNYPDVLRPALQVRRHAGRDAG